MSESWEDLQRRIIACERCPRLRAHCTAVAQEKRAAFREWDYWGRPVPNFGGASARVLVVGLAPAAHGANRTRRCFTGDRSGDFLFRAMHEAGLANQPTSERRDDGLRLIDAAIAGVARCAPPANKPTPQEVANCESFLDETFDLLRRLRVVVALGRIAFDGCLRAYARRGWLAPGVRPAFGHGVEHAFAGRPVLLASFHPSQQNTFTGRLTPPMLLDVFRRAKALAEGRPPVTVTSGRP